MKTEVKMGKELTKKALSLVMMALMVTGAAAAGAYVIKQYTVSMDVSEAIQVQYNGPGGWTDLPTGQTITGSMKPGEDDTQEIKITNVASNGVLGVIVSANPNTDSTPYLSWDGTCGTGFDTSAMRYKVDGNAVKLDIPAGKTYVVNLVTHADGTTPDGQTLTFDTSIGRENPYGDTALTSLCT
jgi:hypothetical protein